MQDGVSKLVTRSPTRRAADNLLVQAQAAAPKPEKKMKSTILRKSNGKFQGNTKKYYENKLDRLNRALVFWRDGGICVEQAIDGANCSGGMELGHIIRRSDSAWLKRMYWNLVVQCNGHNCFHGDPLLHKVVGDERMNALRDEMVAHRAEEPDTGELKRRIDVVEKLLADRPALFFVRGDLVELGYYGPITWARTTAVIVT